MSHSTSISVKGRLWRAVETSTRGIIFSGGVKPTPLTFVPSFGYEGMRYHGTITGSGFTKVIAVSLGADITIDYFTIDSSTQISVVFSVSSAPHHDDWNNGRRNLTVTAPSGVGTLTNAFRILISDSIHKSKSTKARSRVLEVVYASVMALKEEKKPIFGFVKASFQEGQEIEASMFCLRKDIQELPASTFIHRQDGSGVQAIVDILKQSDFADAVIIEDAGIDLLKTPSYEVSLVDTIDIAVSGDVMFLLPEDIDER